MSKGTEILIIEDDITLANGLCLNLEINGFKGNAVHCLKEARSYLEQTEHLPELILLDVNLPDGEGFEFAEEIRAGSLIPVLFLTARDLDEDMLRGFHAGADDYITKPFNTQILIERIRAVLNRYRAAQGGTADSGDGIRKVGNLEIDFDGHEVKKSGRLLSLTPTEFRLLKKFCENPGIVLTREILLEALWDKDGNYVDEHALTLFVSRLRRKIADEEYSYIKNVYGTGYRWSGSDFGL